MKIAIFLAEGFEEIEALTVADLGRRAGITVDLVSITQKEQVIGSHQITVQSDYLWESIQPDTYDMLVFPGGMPGTVNLEAFEPLMEALDRFVSEGKYIGAICAAPRILGHRNLLEGRTACCYPGTESHIHNAVITENAVEISQNIITSRSMGTAIEFSLAIISTLCSKEKAEEIKKAIVY